MHSRNSTVRIALRDIEKAKQFFSTQIKEIEKEKDKILAEIEKESKEKQLAEMKKKIISHD